MIKRRLLKYEVIFRSTMRKWLFALLILNMGLLPQWGLCQARLDNDKQPAESGTNVLLWVTDLQGKSRMISNPVTVMPGVKPTEYAGLCVASGDGEIIIPWAAIKDVTFRKTGAFKLEAGITISGAAQEAYTVSQQDQRLVGNTIVAGTACRFEIPISAVREIVNKSAPVMTISEQSK